jgi:hypothetical protein
MTVDDLIEQAVDVLRQLGLPVDSMTPTRRRHAARVFLALAGLSVGVPWEKAQDKATRHLTTKQILEYGRQNLGEKRSDGSYDDVRREDLRLAVVAGLVEAAANKPGATTNDATRGYGVAPIVGQTIRHFGGPGWDTAISQFRAAGPSLADLLSRQRNLQSIPITIDGSQLNFTSDPHNLLQKAIIEQFLPLFGQGAEVLYVGEAREKYKYLRSDRLTALGFFELGHDELPDVVAYSPDRDWLFLIEAVTSVNPVSEVRRLMLERKLSQAKSGRIYVSAFLNRGDFRKHAVDVAWETEVWIASDPEHLIHFNGDKFLGPHTPRPLPKG